MTRNIMMTQSYYPGGEYDAYHRPSHRSLSAAAYYDRPAPYGYYDQPRQELRSEYGGGRPVTRAMIHEPDLDMAAGSSRRRIAVACSRCRRRKIKCSGDPGDGSGCQACRASGADVAQCNFIRVNSHQMALTGGVEVYPQASSAGSVPPGNGYTAETSTASGWHTTPSIHSRPSLPTLHTRSSWMDNYDTSYESSPVDYTYSATMPRQDSYASSYGTLENYRSWTTTGSLSAPVSASSYYEQPPAYSFGSLQAPSYPTMSSARLPSVTAESFSMNALQTSLPIHTAQERRLPAPYTVTYGPQTAYGSTQQNQIPEVRPLGSYSEPRGSIYSTSSRSSLPYLSEGSSNSGRTPSINHLAPPSALPSLQPLQYNSTAGAEANLGYQYDMNNTLAPVITGSPNVSPTTGPSLSESYQSTASSSSTASMPPPTFRYASSNQSSLPSLNSDEYRSTPSTSQAVPPANLFSFSSETANDRPATSGSDQASSSTASTASGPSYMHTIRQPQPQHIGNVEALRRQSSFDQQRAATAQRMSVSNINGRY